MKRPQIRQGDVLLIPRRKPADSDRVLDEEGLPLAGVKIEGERTGHAHVLPGRVYESGDSRLVFLERPTPITHQEHGDIDVPAGWWEVRVQRELVQSNEVTRWD